jgi:hypothetical protein
MTSTAPTAPPAPPQAVNTPDGDASGGPAAPGEKRVHEEEPLTASGRSKQYVFHPSSSFVRRCINNFLLGENKIYFSSKLVTLGVPWMRS